VDTKKIMAMLNTHIMIITTTNMASTAITLRTKRKAMATTIITTTM
jgi:hypothetical protein